jgi:hypothetical protein
VPPVAHAGFPLSVPSSEREQRSCNHHDCMINHHAVSLRVHVNRLLPPLIEYRFPIVCPVKLVSIALTESMVSSKTKQNKSLFLLLLTATFSYFERSNKEPKQYK